jgi:restriction endonuclease
MNFSNLTRSEEDAAVLYFELALRRRLNLPTSTQKVLPISTEKAQELEKAIKDDLPENKRAEIEKAMQLVVNQVFNGTDVLFSKAETEVPQRIEEYLDVLEHKIDDKIDEKIAKWSPEKQKAFLENLHLDTEVHRSDLERTLKKFKNNRYGGVV